MRNNALSIETGNEPILIIFVETRNYHVKREMEIKKGRKLYLGRLFQKLQLEIETGLRVALCQHQRIQGPRIWTILNRVARSKI